MRDTPPVKLVGQRETEELIEDLCLGLRDVGTRDRDLPNDKRAIAFIREVQLISAEINRHNADNADFQDRIKRLSAETGWQMERLLQECLLYPEVIPYVREHDGVRRAFRCSICEKREVPDRDGIWLCDDCLSEAIESTRSLKPLKGLILFRTYNETKRCKHADSETVLVTFDDEYDVSLEDSHCVQCLADEQNRRGGKNRD